MEKLKQQELEAKLNAKGPLKPKTNGDEFVSKVDDLLMIDGKLFDGENNGQTTVPPLDYDRVD